MLLVEPADRLADRPASSGDKRRSIVGIRSRRRNASCRALAHGPHARLRRMLFFIIDEQTANSQASSLDDDFFYTRLRRHHDAHRRHSAQYDASFRKLLFPGDIGAHGPAAEAGAKLAASSAPIRLQKAIPRALTRCRAQHVRRVPTPLSASVCRLRTAISGVSRSIRYRNAALLAGRSLPIMGVGFSAVDFSGVCRFQYRPNTYRCAKML